MKLCLTCSFDIIATGKVVQGMDVVKAIEAIGSSSGKTSKEVKITASGQLYDRVG